MARILVVDDEESVRTSLETILVSNGHEVLLAEDGVEGLRRFEEEDPDLLVVDMFMPRMDGIELVTQVQLLDASARVVCISGGGQGENWGPLAIVEVMGVRGILMKPFSAEEVISTVQHVLP